MRKAWQKLCAVVMAVMVIAGIGGAAPAEVEAAGSTSTYEKVTTIEDGGEYLIVYDNSKALKNSNGSAVDADVTKVDSNRIEISTNDETNAIWKFNQGSYYSYYVSNNGYYLAPTFNSVLSGEKESVICTSSSGAYRFYKVRQWYYDYNVFLQHKKYDGWTTTYNSTSRLDVNLYKKVDDGGSSGGDVTPEESGTVDDIKLTKVATDKGIDIEGNQIFDIDMTVKGKTLTTSRKVDITLVIDVSGSMDDKDKIGDTTEAAKNFASTVLGQSGSQARISVVKFATDASAAVFTNSGYQGYATNLKYNSQTWYTDSVSAVERAINSLRANGGTNTEAGAVMAKRVTDARNRSDAESIVIFLTDGVPTYYSNGGTGEEGGPGSSVNNDTFNKAVSKMKALKDSGNVLYSIGFLTDFSTGSPDYKCCEKLLSDKAYYERNGSYYTAHGTYSANFEKYYAINRYDDASVEINKIYQQMANTVNALASGTVTDTIPDDFVITNADELRSLGCEISADGKTVTKKNVEAGATTAVIPTIKVKYTGNGYGVAYSNTEATYKGTGTFNGVSGSGFSLNFPDPVVGLHPKTTDDSDAAKVNTQITIDVCENDPFAKFTLDGYIVSDYEIIITDAQGEAYSYTDAQDEFVAGWNADRSQLTFISSTLTTKEFYYVIQATVTKVDGTPVVADGDPYAINGKTTLKSRPTKVTVDVVDAEDKAFVIDFYKPVTYSADAVFNSSELAGVISLSNGTGQYGTMNLNNNKSITYKLQSIMSGVDLFQFSERLKGLEFTKNVKMIPATSVYYDDTFATGETNGDVEINNGITYSDNWTVINDPAYSGSAEQDSAQGPDTNYGTDSGENYIGSSEGTAHRLVGSGRVAASTATVSFTGTGVDFYTKTNNTSGEVVVILSPEDESVEQEVQMVNTSYQTGTLYQVPTITFKDLPYGNYKVEFIVPADQELELDGVRVYNPITANPTDEDANQAYDRDGERNAVVEYVRDALLGSSKKILKAYGTVFIDDYQAADGTVVKGHNAPADSESPTEEYINYGCKQAEAYLPAGESLTFEIASGYNVQLGLKTSQSGARYSINNAADKKLTSSSDMYYDITLTENNGKTQFTITNTGDVMVELTGIKLIPKVMPRMISGNDSTMAEASGQEATEETADVSEEILNDGEEIVVEE